MPRRLVPPRPHRHEPAHGFRIWRMHAVAAMNEAHTHPDIEVNYLFRGGFSYLHGGAATRVEPGRFTVLWGGFPHQVLPPGMADEGIWITVPLAWFLQWRLPNGLQDRVLAGDIVSGPRAEADRALLEGWLADAECGDPRRGRVMQLEMEARFHRLALDLPRRRSSPPAGADGVGRMAEVTRFIAQHYREPLDVPAIARAAGLHPKYLMRVFRKQCGASVWEYLTRLRISHAQRLLITSDMKVLDIAMDSGFSSLAPFYAAFRRHANGSRPLAYRRRHSLDRGPRKRGHAADFDMQTLMPRPRKG